MTSLDIAFAAFALLAAVGGLLAVTTTRVVHAALWLVVALVGVAGAALVLGAELVALVLVLVYVGAIVVLVLFALMLTRAPIGPDVDHAPTRSRQLLAAAAAAATTGLLLSVLLPLAGPAKDRVPVSTSAVANSIFGTWVWPFEGLSLLLLVALIGAISVSRITKDPVGGPR